MDLNLGQYATCGPLDNNRCIYNDNMLIQGHRLAIMLITSCHVYGYHGADLMAAHHHNTNIHCWNKKIQPAYDDKFQSHLLFVPIPLWPQLISIHVTLVNVKILIRNKLLSESFDLHFNMQLNS